jgi:hypothetical protein
MPSEIRAIIAVSKPCLGQDRKQIPPLSCAAADFRWKDRRKKVEDSTNRAEPARTSRY